MTQAWCAVHCNGAVYVVIARVFTEQNVKRRIIVYAVNLETTENMMIILDWYFPCSYLEVKNQSSRL